MSSKGDACLTTRKVVAMLSILHHWSKNKKLVMSRKKFISYPAPSTNVPEIQMHSRASYSFSQTSLLLNIFILTFSSTFIFYFFHRFVQSRERTVIFVTLRITPQSLFHAYRFKRILFVTSTRTQSRINCNLYSILVKFTHNRV